MFDEQLYWFFSGATSAGLCQFVQFCLPGAKIAPCNSILIIHGGMESNVQAILRDTGAFATVDTFDASSATPTPSQLTAYHAVLVYSFYSFSDAVLLGDRLAAFHDLGGGVVVAFGANLNYPGYSLKGAYGRADNGYALLDYTSGSWISPSDSLGVILEQQSPLLTGVKLFAASPAGAYRSTANIIANRGIVVARWRSGDAEPLVIRGSRGNRTLIELNFWPPSTYWTGDGSALLRNALKYSRCMPGQLFCDPGTFSTAGEHC
jgi:hypothetical protein